MAATYSSLVGLAVGGKYEIRRVLGAGGMGVVCEAVHLDLGKRVAIKLIDKGMKESELIVARFRREARAAGQINSEHIVDVFDVGADARVGLYMVMEYLVGEDLQSRLERDKRIDVKTAVMIAHQMARGLAKAHEAGVIHRDLKPANVYLTERDNGHLLVKLLDFGVSKLLDEAPGSARITGTGAPIGTPLYMAPEQAEGKDSVDGRADVWSLGAVLYEALAGTTPFADRGSYHGTIVGILTSRPKLLHDVAPWVPPQVAAVVDAMLVHDPNARLPNAATVAHRLLDAFPTVLPDGTGHHTAVIVSQAAAAIDATGDTEVFNSASMGAMVRSRNPISHPGGPQSRPPQGSGPPRESSPPRDSGPPRGPDSRHTMADTAVSSASATTGSATPIGAGLLQYAPSDHSQPDVAIPVDFETTLRTTSPQRGSAPPSSAGPPSTRLPISGGGPRTAPLPPPSRSSASGGVALPLTPSVIEPLPASLREQVSGPRPKRGRSRALTFVIIVFAIVGVAVGGFFAGRRVRSELTEQGTFSPGPTATVTATATATATTSASAVAPAASASGIAPAATASSPPRGIRRRPKPTPAKSSETPDDPPKSE